MKRKCVKYAAVIAALLAVAVIAGCGKNDAAGLAKSALKNLQKQTSVGFLVTSEMSAHLTGAQSGDLQMEAAQTLDVDYVGKSDAVHTSGTYTQKMRADAASEKTELSTDLENYTVTEDKKRVTYTRIDDLWVRMAGGTTAVDMAKDILGSIKEKTAEASVDEVIGAVDGEPVYVVHAKVPAGEIEGLMATGEGLLGYVESNYSENALVDIYISKSKKQLVKMDIDLVACGNSMIGHMEDMSGAFDRYKMTVAVTDTNEIQKIEVPEEVRSAAVDTSEIIGESIGDDQGTAGNTGGNTDDLLAETSGKTYEILPVDGLQKAVVKAPEGFMENAVSADYLSLFNADGVRLDYTYVEMRDTQGIGENYKTMMSYLADDPLCSDVVFSDEKTASVGEHQVSYICLTWSVDGENRAEYLAWTVDEGMVFSCQMTNLTGADDALVTKVFENIVFE